MVHIVNGDSVAEKLSQGIVQGDVLVWREIYTEGPLFADPSEPANLSVRARYLEQALGIPQSNFMQSCVTQENQLCQL